MLRVQNGFVIVSKHEFVCAFGLLFFLKVVVQSGCAVCTTLMYSVHVQCNCNSGEALQKKITECPMTNTVNIEPEFSNNHFDDYFKPVVVFLEGGGGA